MRVDSSQIIVGLKQRGDDWSYKPTVVGVFRYPVNDLDKRQGEVQQNGHLAAPSDTGTRRRRSLGGPLTRHGPRCTRRAGTRRGGTLELRRSTQPEADIFGHVPVTGVLAQEVDFEAVKETRPPEHIPTDTATRSSVLTKRKPIVLRAFSYMDGSHTPSAAIVYLKRSHVNK